MAIPYCLLSLLLLLFNKPQVVEIKPYIIDYGNGTIVRDTTSVPPSFVPPPNDHRVKSKDITLFSSGRLLRARIFLPAWPEPVRKIPVLVYFHGGAFCIGSPFNRNDTLFLSRVSARARVIALSIEYRMYPDVIIPDPYDDAWAALMWVAAHASRIRPGHDPWLARYGDLRRVYVGGDSAGGNIAHNLGVRAGLNPLPNSVALRGLFLGTPYFLGSERVPFEPAGIPHSPNYRIWAYVCPNCTGGVDNGFINPVGVGAPSLTHLGCEKILVYTAQDDELMGRGLWYYQHVKASAWMGRVRLIEAEGQNHVFFLMYPDAPATKKLIKDFSAFLNSE